MPGIDLEPSRKPLRARFPQGLNEKTEFDFFGVDTG